MTVTRASEAGLEENKEENGQQQHEKVEQRPLEVSTAAPDLVLPDLIQLSTVASQCVNAQR